MNGRARYLLDTNVLSEPLRAVPNPGIVNRLRQTADLCVTAAPVWQELLFGLRRMPPSRRRSTEIYLTNEVRASFEGFQPTTVRVTDAPCRLPMTARTLSAGFDMPANYRS